MTDKPVKIALVQDQPGSGIREPHEKILREFAPDIISFPEYYFVMPDDKSVIDSHSRDGDIIQQLLKWSVDYDCLIVGGSLVTRSNGKFYNRCCLADKGNILGYYDKIHPFRNEGRGGIEPGFEYKVFDSSVCRAGVLICADALYPDSFSNIRGLRPEIIFVPTTSPLRIGESAAEKFNRDFRLFATGSRLADSIVIKVCASGKILNHAFQARSLIAAPDRILWRNPPEEEDKSALILAVLSGPIGAVDLDIVVHRF